ncbi:MAG: PepSY domain-containing protein [Pseudomonadota bacterium]
MKKILLSTTAALAISTAGAVHAQSVADRVVAALQAEGFESIEITTGPTQVKVEAIRNGRKLEAVYDAETGAILDQEVERVDDDDDSEPGVSFETEDEDFLDEDDDEDEDDDDDEDEDDDDDEDEDEDDDDEDDDDEDDEDEDDDDDDDDDEDDDDNDDDDDED